MQKIDLKTEKKFSESEELRKKGKFQDAINILKDIAKDYSDFLPALNNIALNYVNLKNFSEAEKYYSSCLSIKPNELIFINNLAKVFYETNQNKKALPLLQKSLKINDEQLDIMKITAKCLFETNLKDELDVFSSKALKIYPNDNTLRFFYAKNLLRLDKHINGLNILKNIIGVIEFDEKQSKVI